MPDLTFYCTVPDLRHSSLNGLVPLSIAECRPDMEKRADWAALTSAAHFPISGRHPAIENGILNKEEMINESIINREM